MKKTLTLLAAALLLLPACEKLNREKDIDPKDFTEPVPIELTKADETVRNASNAFGMKVFEGLLTEAKGREVSFSPLSLSLALAMVGEGAETDTFKQFVDVLGWGNATKEEIGAYYKKMIEGLVKTDPQVSFSSCNSFWADKTLVLLDAYKSMLTRNFAAESFSVDFSASATKDQINQWCSDKTEGKIPQMLDKLDPETRLMLINALLFKAPWGLTWDVTPGRDFNGTAGKTKKDYLHTKHMLGYGEFEDFEYVAIPYGNGSYEIDVVLPKAGKTVQSILSKVNYEAFQYAYPGTEVDLYLPKWSTEYSSEDDIPNVLKAMGLTLPFDRDRADFSGISQRRLVIDMILQKVRVDVTEKGTEFAAVTVIGMVDNAAGPVTPKKVTLDLNRPFAYFIREKSSNTLLLAGTLSK
jgi:serpin B